MSFWRKLLYYLLGVGLGVLAVMFIFGDRDFQCSYFPNDRVLYDLRKKEVVVPSDVQARMTESGIDTSDLSMMLLTGNVDFENSKTTQEDTCKTYWIDYNPENEGKPFSAYWMNCDSTATVLEIQPGTVKD